MRTIRKDPDEEIFEGFDWTQRLVEGETISASTWEVGAGITGTSGTYTDYETEIELTGGTAGSTVLVTNRITTTEGAVFQRSFKVLVVNR